MTTYTKAGDAAKALEKFAKERGKVECRVIYRGMHRARVAAGNRLRQTGLGAAIFGKKISGLRLLLKRLRMKRTSDGWIGGLEARGLAALMEKGGKTLAHVIRAKGGLLANEAGGFVAAGKGGAPAQVQHPGSHVAATPTLEAAMLAELPSMTTDMDRGLQKFADETVG